MNTQGLYQWTNRVDFPGYTRINELNNSIHEYPRIYQSDHYIMIDLEYKMSQNIFKSWDTKFYCLVDFLTFVTVPNMA